MRIVLLDLVEAKEIYAAINGKSKYFWIREPKEMIAQQDESIRPFRPLKGYEATMRAIAEMRVKGR